jgi:hypothetical protein
MATLAIAKISQVFVTVGEAMSPAMRRGAHAGRYK